MKVLRGRWGIYFAIGKVNYKIPKGVNPEALTLDDCLKIAKEQDGGETKSAKTTKGKKKK